MANGGIGGEATKVGVGQVLVVVGVGQEIAPVVGVSPVAARSVSIVQLTCFWGYTDKLFRSFMRLE
jgi:hypothetical protein